MVIIIIMRVCIRIALLIAMCMSEPSPLHRPARGELVHHYHYSDSLLEHFHVHYSLPHAHCESDSVVAKAPPPRVPPLP